MLPKGLGVVLVIARILFLSISSYADTSICLRRIKGGNSFWEDVSGVFDPIRTRTFDFSEVLEEELKTIYRKLLEELKQEGFEFALNFVPPNINFLSPGVDSGRISTSPQESLGYQSQEGWNVISRQWPFQGRSLSIVFVENKEGNLKSIVRIEKGSGLYDPKELGFNQSPLPSELIEKIQELNLVRPFYFYSQFVKPFSRKETEKGNGSFDDHTVIGGMLVEEAIREFKKALGIHAILIRVDGEKASVFIPQRIDLVEEVVLRKGEDKIVLPLEDYLTSVDYLAKGELLTLAYLVRNLATDVEKKVLTRYIDLLWERRYILILKSPRNSKLMEEVKAILKKYVKLAIETKFNSTDLRLLDAHNAITQATSVDTINAYLSYIYAQYGEKIKFPIHQPEIRSEDDVYAYLRQVWELNKKAASRIEETFNYRLLRTIGALHGAGGHIANVFDGRPDGPLPQDVDIDGTINDIADAYIPVFGINRRRNWTDHKGDPIPYDEQELSEKNLDIESVAGNIAMIRSILFGIKIKRDELYRRNEKLYRWCEEKLRRIYEEYYQRAKEIFAPEGN